MTNKHRHHYIPQGFLRGFSQPSSPTKKHIWVYRKNKNSKPKMQSSKSVGYRKDYYAQETENGVYDYNTLENAFSELESKVLPIIANLKVDNQDLISISELEKGEVSYFLGLLFTRCPSIRDGIDETYKEIVRNAFYNAMKQQNLDNSLINNLHSHSIDAINIDIKQWVSLKPMLIMAEKLAMSILNKNWQFFSPSGDSRFITSDSPVIFYGQAPASPDSIVIINLRKDLSLICTPNLYNRPFSVKSISEESVKNINLAFIDSAKEFVFSSENDNLINEIVKERIGIFQGLIC